MTDQPGPNRFTRLGLAGAILLLAAGAETSGATNYKKWLQQEVVWIISKAEEEAFLALKDRASRDRFIEEFWRRRDPTPGTERNEYKEEHYRRLLFANKMFREGVPGWKTDRGRVYILHGQPDSESFFRSRSAISATRAIPSTARSPNTILWSYHNNPNARYYKGEIRLVFQPNSGMNRQAFVLSESKTAQDRAEQMSRQFFPASDSNWFEADIRYRLVMAGPPAIINAMGAELPNSGLGEFSRYLDDLLRSPGELLEERERELARRQAIRQELAEVSAEVAFEPLEVGLSSQAFWRGNNEWWLPIQITVPSREPAEAVDVYAALIDAEGKLFDEFVDSLDPEAGGGQRAEGFEYRNSFTLPSGEFLLRVVARGQESRATGVQQQQIRLADATPEKLRMDTLLVTNRVSLLPEEQAAGTASVGAGVVFDRTHLLPSRSDRFQPDNYLFLYSQVWLPAGSESATINVNFILDGEIVRRTDPRKVKIAGTCLAEYGSAFPLEDLQPGSYTVHLQAIDPVSRSYAIQRASFRIEDR